MNVSRRRIKLGDYEVYEITLENTNGVRVSFLTYGGIITRVEVPDNKGKFDNIVLAYNDYEDYLRNPGHLGAIIGRTAGRIKDGQFTINGKNYRLAKNYGENSGHGGETGFDKHLYSHDVMKSETGLEALLSRVSPHMEEGYPGELHVRVKYTLSEDNVFSIEYHGNSSEDTLFNMTNHSYFNLSGSFQESIKYHELFIDADHYAEIDDSKAPTGQLISVQGTPFDFRFMREIGEEMNAEDNQLKIAKGYDHAFLFKENGGTKVRLAHRYTGRVMEIETDNQAVVVYTQNFSQGQVIHNGEVLEPYRSIALEVQKLPIGANEVFKEFSMLEAEKSHVTTTKFRFFVE
ncbi:aldose epimerase family protein [Proteiniclasticum sp. C24MP]|uniref:aldose epimerase family protein n=1 Tax=Proteiniclasticum sp. C24MP TaxID=3374101 RepID=UPI003754E4B0